MFGHDAQRSGRCNSSEQKRPYSRVLLRVLVRHLLRRSVRGPGRCQKVPGGRLLVATSYEVVRSARQPTPAACYPSRLLLKIVRIRTPQVIPRRPVTTAGSTSSEDGPRRG
ncbi:hypothetical protein MTP99_006014 [Tenebrio molitor]|nr:hypothetical protein MTP99_006014 [Tenebrio molitor]